jgi:muconate cycloisomerase
LGYLRWAAGHRDLVAAVCLFIPPVAALYLVVRLTFQAFRELSTGLKRPNPPWRPTRLTDTAALEQVASAPVPVPLESFNPFSGPNDAQQSGYALADDRHAGGSQASNTMNAPSVSLNSTLTQVAIEAIEVTIVNLPCKATFHLSGGDFSRHGQPTPRALVKLVGSNGATGWGEVTPCPTWCYETSETIATTIRKYLAPALLGMPAWDIDSIARKMERVINPGATIGQPLAKSGIDVALHDMLARTLQVPLGVLLGGKRLDQIQLSYIVSAASASEASEQAKRGLELGYSAFKIKVGLHGEEQDFQHVAAVYETVPKGTFLWVDANQGYGLDNAIRQAKRLGTLGVAAFEQPLRGSRPSEFRRLVQLGALPIAIDESLCSPTDLMEYIKAGAVDLPVAKVQRCGGLWWTKQFCHIAEAANLRLMGSGLCETDLGLATGVHLFAAFGIDLPCDLNGRQFVESAYLRSTVDIENGWVTVPDLPGTGVEVDPAKVREFDSGI